MIKTKHLITDLNEIPREWVFEHYLQLNVKLTGQDIKMKSIFNPKDTNPSFFVFYSSFKRKYKFKDFSMGYSGDGTELVMKMFHLTSRGEAAHKIMNDYNEYVLKDPEDYNKRKFEIQEKYKVIDYKTREWVSTDGAYWLQYQISSKMLEHYNVKPLEYYTMGKEENGIANEFTITHQRIYGYFKKDGTLYKIYQPNNKVSKFLKVTDYIQGIEQLTFKKPYLVICSSLKDVMAFRRLGYKSIEVIGPDSENILIDKNLIADLKTKYQTICTLFDNDGAGLKSMKKYEEEYGISYANLKLEKDLSDSVKDHGINNVKIHLTPLLKKALNINYEVCVNR